MSGEQPILEVRDLKVWFPLRRSIKEILARAPVRYVHAVDGISFDVFEGETFCLVGESGCGKTTTGKAILRLVDIYSGSVRYRPTQLTLQELEAHGVSNEDGWVDIAKIPPKKMKPLRKELQIVYQDPYGSLDPRFRVKDTLEEPLIIHGIGETPEEREELIVKALEDVKLVPPEDIMQRYPHQLSGGQRQRVAFARAVILNPRLVVTD